MAKAKKASLSLIDVINKKSITFEMLQDIIFRADVKEIASRENLNFWSEFLNKFNSPVLIGKIAGNILDKLNTYKQLHYNKEITNNLIYALKAETLLIQGKNILNIIKENPEAATALRDAQKAVGIIEESYWVYQSIFNLNKQVEYREPLLLKINQTHQALNEVIESIADIQEQFNLCELALQHRQSYIKEGQGDYLVDLLIKLGSYGTKIPSQEIKLAAMKYSEEAYNIACKHNIDKHSAPVLFAILNNIKDLAREFGDMGKVKLILNQIDYFESKLGLEQEEKKDNDINKIYVPILEQGSSTDVILSIKQQIQQTVLNGVQEAASIGKWFNHGIIANYGVSGYLNEAWLTGQLGDLNSEENLKIALKLCFEAVNIGIMNAEIHNPLCAAIFAKEYPGLIDEMLRDNPEYFVDGSILRVSLLDANAYSQRLIGMELNENNAGYNIYFEKEMTKIIADRTQDAILTPIKHIITNQEWSPAIAANLTHRLSDEFIKQAIGNNLPQMPDLFNIVRILALKEITHELDASGSMIFAPVQLFTQLYPELVKRVQWNHADYVDDETVARCIKLEFERQELELAEAQELAKKEEALIEQENAVIAPDEAGEQEIQVMGDAEDQAV